MTLSHAHMHMRNTLFCLKRQVIGFVRNRFVYKLFGMVVYIIQTKAKILETACLLLRKVFFVFYSSVTALWFAVH